MVLDKFRKVRTDIINRIFKTTAVEENTLLYWRVHILISILLTASVIGILALAAAVLVIIKERTWILAFVDGLGFLIIIGLLFIKGFSYKIRATSTLILCYLLGLSVIFNVGTFSGGPIYLFTFAVLAGVLLGSRAAISAVILNCVTISVICWLIYSGRIGQTFPFFNSVQAMKLHALAFFY